MPNTATMHNPYNRIPRVVKAGFPSPAADHFEPRLNLHDLLIRNKTATFFMRVEGDSMIGAGVHDGDILIVDRSIPPDPGMIVVATWQDDFVVKRLTKHDGMLQLESVGPKGTVAVTGPGDDIEVWGVAVHVVHKLL